MSSSGSAMRFAAWTPDYWRVHDKSPPGIGKRWRHLRELAKGSKTPYNLNRIRDLATFYGKTLEEVAADYDAFVERRRAPRKGN